MITSQQKKHLIELADLPFQQYSSPSLDADGNILIFAANEQNSILTQCIYKYDPVEDKFIPLFDFTLDDIEIKGEGSAISAMDTGHNIFYLITKNHIHSIALTYNNESKDDIHKTYDISESKSYGLHIDPTAIVVSRKLHIFCNNGDTNYHCIYDRQSNHFEADEVDYFPLNGEFGGHGMVSLKKQNKLLFAYGDLNGMMSYDIDTKKWKPIDDIRIGITVDLNELATGRYLPGIILTMDEKYVIVFGGSSKDSIEIYDVKNNMIRDCPLKCPTKEEFRAVLLDNFETNYQVISGFIRRYYSNKVAFPSVLMELVTNFYGEKAYIHLTEIGGYEHWKIWLSDILSTL
eukprot:427985_1